MTKQIALTNGNFTLVDDKDYEWLNSYEWHCSNNRACRMTSTETGKRTSILMSRQIMNFPIGKLVDHKNGNSLDNQRSNLRVCTKGQNNMNKGVYTFSMSSDYKGVCWREHAKKWKAYIKINRKQIHLGYFSTEKEAALAYNEGAKLYHGEFARLNEVKNDTL